MKGISSEKGRLPKSIFGDFWWFLGSPGEAKNAQKWKKCLPKIDRKKGGKKGGEVTRPWSGSAAIARPEGMQDSCSGRFLPWFLTIDLQTPPLPAECGGLSSHTRRPPHSTRLLGAHICEEADQNLGDSWQNIASENATSFAKSNVEKSSKFIKK